jgi:hypothetical protein
MRNSLRMKDGRQEEPVKRRGRGKRHESEVPRTIAWFHALLERAAVCSVKDLAAFLGTSRIAGCEVDVKTLHRYRIGSSTPDPQRRRHIESLLPGTNLVFDEGPFGLPLWGAMWGKQPRRDLQCVALADLLVGGEDLPLEVSCGQQSISDWFSERAVASWPDDIGPHQAALLPFLTAIFLDRWYLFLGSPSDLTRYWLIRSCLDGRGTRLVLERYGVGDWIKNWIEERELHRVRSDSSLERWITQLGIDARMRSPVQRWLNGPEDFLKHVGKHPVHLGRGESGSARGAREIEFDNQVFGSKVRVPLEHLH